MSSADDRAYQSPAAAGQKGQPRATHVRWLVFALACGTSWLLYLHRYLFALMKPMLKEEWGLKETELGLLDSAFTTCYSVFQIPLGVAVDAGGVRLVLMLLMLVGSVGLALHAGVGSSGQMWYARATLGVGQSAVYAALSRLSRQWFPPSIRTTLQGFVGVLAGRLGGFSANLIFLTLLVGYLSFDWRTATYLFASLGIVQTILFFVLYRNSPREHPLVNSAEAALIEGEANGPATDAGQDKPAPPRMTMGAMLRSLTPRGLANLVALCVQSLLSTFADNVYSNWIPLFLFSVHGLQAKEMGIYSALPLLGGAIGGVLGGLFNDLCIAWTGNRRWSRSGVAAFCKGLAAAWLLVALLFYDQPYAFCGLLFVVKLFGDGSLATTWGVVTDIGGRATSSVYAFTNAVAGIGAIAAATVFGYVAEHHGWRAVFFTVAGLYVACAVSWMFVNCTVPIVTEESGRAPR